jgi:CheY-like chemotaxis protein
VKQNSGRSYVMPKAATILLAEDDENDVFFFRHALEKAELDPCVFHVADGQEAVNYLGGKGPYSDRKKYPLPNLILLDLKMPRLNGFEVLQWVRTRERLSQVPIVVLSSSDHERDRAEAQRLGACSYHRKPGNPADLVSLVREFCARWLKLEPAY